MKNRALMIVVILFTGCTIGNGHICGPQTPTAYCNKDAYEKLMHSKPYGAHWIKEGMTQESRRSDFIQCGGDVNLREGYAEWLSSIPYETYSAGKTQHIRSIAACMRSKNYVWQDSCNARCLYP